MKVRSTMTAFLAMSLLTAVACGDDDEDTTDPPPADQVFGAVLLGSSEKPNPVTSNASGVATFTVSTSGATTTITYAVVVAGALSGPLTAAHIHGPADANTATGIIVTLNVAGSGTSGNLVTGSFTTTGHASINMATLLQHMTAGQTYVNLHTTANPGGEIRGQLARTN